MPVISIIMPVKNADQFLDQCIDSIIHQDFESWELIAVDDNSTDKSLEILDRFESLDNRIVIVNNPSEGIIPALQYGFEQSKGTFITRMDADDIMPVNKLSVLNSGLKGRLKVVVTGKVRYFSDVKVSEGYRRYESWINAVVEEQDFATNLYRECVIASPNWLVHRSCFEAHFSFSDLTYPEDYDMVFKWMEHAYQLEGINQTTHLWREHPKRTSRNSEYYQQQSFFKLKTRKFIQHFSDEIAGVQLIGKGDKGKMVAGILDEHNIPYEWFDLQPVDGKQQSVLDVQEKLTILSNWPTDVKTQSDISEFLRKKKLKFGEKLWLF